MRPKLTILSSFAPVDANPGRAQHQQDAYDSWQSLGAEIIVFNKNSGFPPCQHVETPSDPPSIRDMLKWYAPDRQKADEGTVAIVNSDIILTEAVLGVLKITEQTGRMWAATSFRREIYKQESLGVKDQGLDFFAMSRTVASRLACDIPDFLTMGRNGWDNFVNGWLRKNLPPQRYFNITDWGFVYHPRHERKDNRLSGFTKEQTDHFLHHPTILAGGIPQIKFLPPSPYETYQLSQ